MKPSEILRESILHFQSRLLERQLYLTLFEGQDRNPFLKALLSYQNSDGGFGNGLEPDLCTPESSAIALETALYYFDCIGFIPRETAADIISWLENKLTKNGTLPHPTEQMTAYPHQPWWKNKDDNRILAIMGLLLKLNVPVPEEIHKRVLSFAENFPLPESLEEYDYPIFLYALYSEDYPPREKILNRLRELLPELCKKKASSFIPFTRYWKFFQTQIDEDSLKEEYQRLVKQLAEEGDLPEVYPELPWWHSIFCLDALIAMESCTLHN